MDDGKLNAIIRDPEVHLFEVAAVDSSRFMERAANAMNRIASMPDSLSQRTA